MKVIVRNSLAAEGVVYLDHITCNTDFEIMGIIFTVNIEEDGAAVIQAYRDKRDS